MGLRPLIKKTGTAATSLLSRDHTIVVSRSGLITISGGKWTTYRKMAEDASKQGRAMGKTAAKSLCHNEPPRSSHLAARMLRDATAWLHPAVSLYTPEHRIFYTSTKWQ